VPLLGRELGPCLTQRGLGRGVPPYQVAYLDPSSCLATIDICRKELAAVSLSRWESGSPCNTIWPGPWVESYTSVPSGILIHPVLFGHNRHGPKSGGCCAHFAGGWVAINVAWAEAYLSTMWHLSPSSRRATRDMGLKLGAVTFGGERGSTSNTMWPGPRPTSTPSGILIHPTVWPQYNNVTDTVRQTDRIDVQDRTDNGQIAQCEPLYTSGRPC